MSRTPNEILNVLWQAQGALDDSAVVLTSFDLHGLMWEVIADVIDSCALATREAILRRGGLSPLVADAIADEMTMTVNDYVANHYGDS